MLDDSDDWRESELLDSSTIWLKNDGRRDWFLALTAFGKVLLVEESTWDEDGYAHRRTKISAQFPIDGDVGDAIEAEIVDLSATARSSNKRQPRHFKHRRSWAYNASRDAMGGTNWTREEVDLWTRKQKL